MAVTAGRHTAKRKEVYIHILYLSKKKSKYISIRNGALNYQQKDKVLYIYNDKLDLLHTVKDVSVDDMTISNNDIMLDFYGKIKGNPVHVFTNGEEQSKDGQYLFTFIEMGLAFK